MFAIAFDVYGTLINTHGLIQELQKMVGGQAEEFSRRWRNRQLEFSFRRSQMDSFVDFSVCTKQALDTVNNQLAAGLTTENKSELLRLYRRLPAYNDAQAALDSLKRHYRLFAFSNGSAHTVQQLLEQAKIAHYFEGIISVELTQRFKPDPIVYQHFLRQARVDANDCWLVSGNPFDILGAKNCGMRTAWIRRDGAVFDAWEDQPDLTMDDLGALVSELPR